MARQLYQLAPSVNFTEPQRRELNAIFLRISTDLPQLLAATILTLGPLPATGATAQTDANFATLVSKLNAILGTLTQLGVKTS